MFQFYVYMQSPILSVYETSLKKFGKIESYGCHCNLDDTNLSPGDPVDSIDAACKKWKQVFFRLYTNRHQCIKVQKMRLS